MLTIHDPIERMFAEGNLQVFHYIVEKSIDASVVTDANLQVMYANSASEQLLGCALTGKSLESIWFQDDLSLLNKITDWARSSGFFSAARINGFRSVIDAYPNVKIVGTLAADWNRDFGRHAAAEFLTINPPGTLDVIWAASSEMALGAVEAVEAAGRQDDVKVFSNDVTTETAAQMRQGRLAAETYHGFPEWGWYGVQFAVRLALGQHVPPTFDVRPRTMYRENINCFHPVPYLEPIDWNEIKSGQALPDKIVIGWIQMGDTEVYQTATQFFEKAAQEARDHGIDVQILSRIPSTSEDFRSQAAIIEFFIRQKVDVIALSTMGVDVIKGALQKAKHAGIGIIIVNQLEPIPGIEVDSYLGFDNAVAGKVSAYAVLNHLGGPGVLRCKDRAALEPETQLDLPWWETLYRDADPNCAHGRIAIIEGISGSKRGEHRLDCRSGVIHVDTTTFPIYDARGQFKGLVATFRDATARKKVEEHLRTALQKEQQLRELRDRFTTNMSHEIRTPLAIINSAAGMLYNYDERLSPENRSKKLLQIMEQVQQMVRMLDNILLIRSAEGEYLQFSPQPVDLRAVCEAIANDLQIGASKHFIDFEYEGNLSPAVMDQQLILHIVSNLLSNAIKYSPEGGRIGFLVRATEDTAVITIQDHGIGIPQADQETIFKDFYRARNVGTIRGTGLGLSIVRQAVELHGGTVNLESTVGVGTTITVALPFRTVLPAQQS